jgi:hypothetical protein
MPRYRLAATLLSAATVIAANPAHAATCEEAFVKKGNPVTGLRFTAAVTVADLPPAVAIGQMRGIVAGKGYDIMADEAEFGSMLIEQPMTGNARAFPIQITATQTGGIGTVVMEAKLRAGQAVGADAAKTEMCGILSQIKGGKLGAAAAKKGATATTVAAAPVKISALGLSQQVSKDTERNAAGILTRYKGKQFTVDGLVDYVTKDGSAFRIGYKIPNPWEQAIRLPNQADFKTDIVCYMAPGQAAYSLQLKPGKSIKLTGTVEDFDQYKHILWMKDCRPAQ